MAEYIVPGGYAAEFDSGIRAMEGIGTSTAGFVGLAERGPVMGRPILLTSLEDYRRQFGGYLSEPEYGSYRYLPYAVEQFFLNGGSTCYVMRVAPKDAAAAKSPDGKVIVTAQNPGAWANTIQVIFTRAVRARTQVLAIRDNGAVKQYQLKNTAGFRVGDIVSCASDSAPVYRTITAVNGDLVSFAQPLPDDVVDREKDLEACGVDVVVRCGSQEECCPGCSLNAMAPDYLLAALEKSAMVTMELKLEDKADDLLVMLGGSADQEQFQVNLSGGLNGSMDSVNPEVFNGTDGGPGKRTGIEAFREIADVSIMAVPGVADPKVQAQLIAHCEELANRFAVLDAPLDCTGVDALNAHRSRYDSSYAALYAPWVQVYDPLINRSVFLPPSGSVCGIYARTDAQRGVHKAPTNEMVRGCTGLAVSYSQAEQGKLHPNGVNLIQTIPGQGIRVWGARTCSNDSKWKYVNVRRLFIFLEEAIRANTNWVAFEHNDEALWSRIQGTISRFLETQRRSGALMGSTAEEAYYVKAGATTMTRDDIRNGRLICEIGVAPVRPAEFFVFRITHTTQSGA